MKFEIVRVTKVFTPLVLDFDKINFEKFISDLSEYDSEIPSNLNINNISKYLNENEGHIFAIFDIANNNGHGEVLKDYYSDESDYFTKYLD